MDLAQACGACIVGFNVKPPPSSVSQAANQAGVKVWTFIWSYHNYQDIQTPLESISHQRIDLLTKIFFHYSSQLDVRLE